MRELCVGDRLDGYRITDLVARGGMSSVYRAVDDASGARAVLKVPHPQYESDVVFHDRFRREEAIGLRLDHPGVVRTLPRGDASRLYLAMEQVEGQLLSQVLHRRGRLPADEAVAIAVQVCETLAYVHAQGVVHRDIKPENLLLTADGRVKLLDFGIALLGSARRLTWHGFSTPVGTPDYMAPEQARGRRGDERSDVYAVGTLLYEATTGALPFEAGEPLVLLRAKASEEPRLPSYFLPGFDPSLQAVIMKAIARQPRDRFASASALLAALRDPAAAARALAERVRAPSRPTFARRQVARSLALAAIVAGLASLVWLSHARSTRDPSLAGDPAPSARAERVGSR